MRRALLSTLLVWIPAVMLAVQAAPGAADYVVYVASEAADRVKADPTLLLPLLGVPQEN